MFVHTTVIEQRWIHGRKTFAFFECVPQRMWKAVSNVVTANERNIGALREKMKGFIAPVYQTLTLQNFQYLPNLHEQTTQAL